MAATFAAAGAMLLPPDEDDEEDPLPHPAIPRTEPARIAGNITDQHLDEKNNLCTKPPCPLQSEVAN
jgi:hypothetical protein